jgi:hypothetical protein
MVTSPGWLSGSRWAAAALLTAYPTASCSAINTSSPTASGPPKT